MQLDEVNAILLLLDTVELTFIEILRYSLFRSSFILFYFIYFLLAASNRKSLDGNSRFFLHTLHSKDFFTKERLHVFYSPHL
jgi:hypothetical protein